MRKRVKEMRRKRVKEMRMRRKKNKWRRGDEEIRVGSGWEKEIEI